MELVKMVFYYGKMCLCCLHLEGQFHVTQRWDGVIPFRRDIFLRREPRVCSRLAEPLQGARVLQSWSLSSRNSSDGWAWEKELDRLSSAPFSLYPWEGSARLAGRARSYLQFALWWKELPSRNRNENKHEVFQLCQGLNILNLGGAVLAPGFK